MVAVLPTFERCDPRLVGFDQIVVWHEDSFFSWMRI
jgi:hypothetical protein